MREQEQFLREQHSTTLRMRKLMRSIGIEPLPFSGFCQHHLLVQYEPSEEHGAPVPCTEGC